MPHEAWVVVVATLVGCGGGGGAGGGDAAGSTGGAHGPDYPAAFTLHAFDGVRITSDSTQPNFQHADAEVDLGAGPFASVHLVADLASTCYPFTGWQADPPPPGQNWPADCDAFDRNYEFSFDDPAGASDPPGIELVRAITPFGGPLHLDVDLTDVANGLPGKHALRVVIPTWSDSAGQVSGSNGGWNVDAKLVVTPGKAPRRVLAVVPLFDGQQTDPTSPPPVSFHVPNGATSGRVAYRATGHGGGAAGPGCIGPAEEFCTRTHTLSVDGASVFSQPLWRTDCASLCTITHYDDPSGGFDYCLENPCGSIPSVQAPRANWCPGSETPPVLLDAPALGAPGDHSFSWTISALASGGEWRLSATYFAFGD